MAIHSKLCGCHGMDSCHQTLNDSELVMHNLGQWREAIRGAGGIGDDGVGRLVILVVDTDHIDGDRILRRCRDDDLLCATAEVKLSFLLLRENTSRLADILCSGSTPTDAARLFLMENLN